MASGVTHYIAGGAAALAIAYIQDFDIIYICFGVIGGLWPDTDIKQSILGRFVPLWLFFKHRGFTHTWLAACLFSGIVFLGCGYAASLCFLGGYASHLFLDGKWRR